jgi:hypothetical protein
MALKFITDLSQYSSTVTAGSYFPTGGFGISASTGISADLPSSITTSGLLGGFTAGFFPGINTTPTPDCLSRLNIPVPGPVDFVLGMHIQRINQNTSNDFRVVLQGANLDFTPTGVILANGAPLSNAGIDIYPGRVYWLEIMFGASTATVAVNGLVIGSYSVARPTQLFFTTAATLNLPVVFVTILSCCVWTIDGTSLLGDFPHGPVLPRTVVPDGDSTPLNFTPNGGGTHFSKVVGADIDGGAGVVASAPGEDRLTLGNPVAANRILGVTGFAAVRSAADAGALNPATVTTGGTADQSFTAVPTIGRALVYRTTTAATGSLSSPNTAEMSMVAS